MEHTAIPAENQSAHTLHSPNVQAKSGYHFQSPETQRLQDDEFANPGMLWVDRGAELWQDAPDKEASACAGCHSDASQTMRGVANTYPKINPQSGRLMNLEAQINWCRETQQKQRPWPYESQPLLAMTAYIAHQSKGLPQNVSIDGEAHPYFVEGERYFYARRGQMDLACSHCHEQNVGKMLRGDRLSQGQVTGYPIYRLEWQTLGSLHRRLRFCNTGVRAEPFPFGAPEYLSLELYLAWRGQGLNGETPGVRR